MNKRSTVSMPTLFKGARFLAPYPWIFLKLARLQVEKWFYPHFIPNVEAGIGGRIHQLSIRITDLCNLRCHTCGQWGDNGFLHGSNLRSQKESEVGPNRYREILEDLVEHKHRPNVYIWGGEPMLYEGLLQVIRDATALRLPVSIATNGHRLARVTAELVDIPLFLLQVSVDGHTEQIHDQARPSAGKGSAFADVVSGLNQVKKEKKRRKTRLPVVASLTVVSKNNVHHLKDIYTTFRDRVDVFIFYLSWWIDEEQAACHEQDFFQRFCFPPTRHRGWIGNWRPDDYERLAEQFEELRHLAKGAGAPSITFLPDLATAAELQSYYTDHHADFGFTECISIFQAAELNSNGDLSPCRDYHDYIVGNIKDQTLTELWNTPSYLKFRKSLRSSGLMPVCRRCCGLMGY